MKVISTIYHYPILKLNVDKIFLEVLCRQMEYLVLQVDVLC